MSITPNAAPSNDGPCCSWCNQPFRARQTGGRSQRFCRTSCRRKYHAAARAWVLHAIENGALTIAEIQNGFGATRALLGQRESPNTKHNANAPPNAPARFLVEVQRPLIDALIFVHRDLQFDERNDLRAILRALDRLGHGPAITLLG